MDLPKASVPPSRSSFSLVAAWALLLLGMLGYVAFQWPSVDSFITFGFRDLGSFATLEDLIHKNLRLGVDVGYSYGLLPVLLQHIAWLVVRGPVYRLGIVFGLVYLALISCFWALLWRQLGSRVDMLIALLLLTPWTAMYLPVAPYALLQLSLMFGILFLFYGDLPKALAFGVLGWLSVPSLSIIFAALVCGWIVVTWWSASEPRKFPDLLRSFLPAAVTGVPLIAILAMMYGWKPVYSTLIPTAGAAMYKALNYGILGVGWGFVHPKGARIGYYLGTSTGWWLLGLFAISVFALRGVVLWWRERRVSSLNQVILTCFALEIFFVAVAFGNGFHTMYYNPLIVAALLAGLTTLSVPMLERGVLLAFVGLGILATTSSDRALLHDWKTCRRFAATGGLYAPEAFEAEWQPILQAARTERVLVLSYGNGVREFYPQIEAPDAWFLLPGLLKETQKQKLLGQIRRADMVAEETQENTRFIDEDPDIQAALHAFAKGPQGTWFRVRVRSK